MIPLESSVFSFLDHLCDPRRPLLVAFSGGADSQALLSILLEYRKRVPIDLAAAHIDHGWRQESAFEAEGLKKFTESNRIPFHLKTMSPDNIQGNLEAGCRLERLKFFRELCLKFGYQAVLLAHHADDQAETVLKRCFEGASLANLAGLRPVTEIDGVPIWRPLLSISKKDILKYVQDKGLKFIEDITNYDPRFLRGKFRTRLMPFLSSEFGKEISPALCKIGKEAHELREFMQKRIFLYLNRVVFNPLGSLLDLSEEKPDSLFEMKYLIRQFCEKEDLDIASPIIQRAAEFMIEGKPNRKLMMGEKVIYIDRGRLFLRPKDDKDFKIDRRELSLGSFQIGQWKIEISPCFELEGRQTDWKSFWQKGNEVILPKGIYTIGPALLNAPYPRNGIPLKKWWTDHKVPAFLRQIVPVIWQGDQICHEFLSGRRIRSDKEFEPWIRVKVSC